MLQKATRQRSPVRERQEMNDFKFIGKFRPIPSFMLYYAIIAEFSDKLSA